MNKVQNQILIKKAEINQNINFLKQGLNSLLGTIQTELERIDKKGDCYEPHNPQGIVQGYIGSIDSLMIKIDMLNKEKKVLESLIEK